MKKFLLSLVLLCTVVMASAQSEEMFKASLDRIDKIVKLKKPKATELVQVNELLTKSGDVALESMNISTSLHKVNEFFSTGEIDVISLSDLEQLLKSAVKISAESLPAIVKLTPDAAEEVKTIKNPLKLKGALSVIDYSKTVVEVVTEETTFQIDAIKGIIQKIKEMKE